MKVLSIVILITGYCFFNNDNSVANKLFSNINNLRNSDTVFWNEQTPLTYSDFLSKIDAKDIRFDSTSRIISLASSSISFSYKLSIEGNDIKVLPYSYFVRSKSWIGVQSKKVLEHEQIHFDISEIYARLFKQETKKYSIGNDTYLYLLRIKSLSDSLHNEHSREQDEYDSFAMWSYINQEHYRRIINDRLKSLSIK